MVYNRLLHCSGVTYQRALIIAPDVCNRKGWYQRTYILKYFLYFCCLSVHKSCVTTVKKKIKLFLHSAYLGSSNIIESTSMFSCLFVLEGGWIFLLDIYLFSLPASHALLLGALEAIPVDLGVKVG